MDIKMTKIYKVYIQGPGAFPYAKMFLDQGDFVGVDDPTKADIICYTGGADVHPSTYGEVVDPSINCYYDIARDRADVQVFEMARAAGIYQVGICRGGQFLNVMSGGKLWYDVDNHTRHHPATPVILQDGVLVEGNPVIVSSTHHQQFIAGPKADILLIADQSTFKVNANDQWFLSKANENDDEMDLEALWYEHTGSLCFQPHPEFNEYPECRKLFFQFLRETYAAFIVNNRSQAG